MLCRGDLRIPPATQAQLKCRYVHNNVPFLRLMPLKEEEAYLEPRIILYRDVMYDSEIDLIKKMAQPRVRPFCFSVACPASNAATGSSLHLRKDSNCVLVRIE